MSAEVAALLSSVWLIVIAVILSELDDASQRKADADRERWADDATDWTGGNR